ncbi:MAG: methyltransferase domain-containing protein [Candidatus Acidiferrum sp.]
MPEATQFQDAAKYSEYLRTCSGRLRSDLAWQNLQKFLPDFAWPLRALDLGGGTGAMSVRLARKEFQVVLLDSSEEMLGIARKEAGAAGVAEQISFCRADAAQLQELFEAESFDIVVCHNLLEYVADPTAIVRGIASILRKNAVVSLLLRNRAGEVLKASIKSPDWELAKNNLSAEKVVDSLYGKPVRVFDPADVVQMIANANLDAVAEHGVRVFSDYRHAVDPNDETYRQLLELELILGARPEFAAIARYVQIIAQHSRAAQASERRT